MYQDSGSWDEILSEPWLPWSLRVPSTFDADTRRHQLDDVTVIDRRSGPFSGVRGHRQTAATSGDFLIVRIVRSGSEVFRQDRGEWLLEAGDAVVWESDRPVRFAAAEPIVTRSLVIHRRALHDVGCPLTATSPVAAGRVPAVHLLSGYLDALSAMVPGLSGHAAVGARNALLELVWGALRPTEPQDPEAVKPARWAAVEQFLETRLGHQDLSAGDVAAALGISVRTLTRLFADYGATFSAVVRAKRIARVRHELLTSDATVESLARRWGFFDTSHLNRRFRATHGIPPHEYRRQHREAGSEPVAPVWPSGTC